MTTKPKLINPLPIEFDEETHRYIWTPTNEIMANSVTSITGFDMPESKRKSIEQFKHIWAPRGTAVHKALEWFLKNKKTLNWVGVLGLEVPETLYKSWENYIDWIKPLLEHEYIFKDFEPLAVEYRVVDLKNSIGGTLDAYGIDTRTNKTVLMDLKTQSNPNANAYNTNEQLGDYYSMLSSNGIQVDECRTIWCRPNKTVVGEYQNPAQCYSDWIDKLDIWRMYQEEF